MNETKDHYFSDTGLEITQPDHYPLKIVPDHCTLPGGGGGCRGPLMAVALTFAVALQVLALIVQVVTR